MASRRPTRAWVMQSGPVLIVSRSHALGEVVLSSCRPVVGGGNS